LGVFDKLAFWKKGGGGGGEDFSVPSSQGGGPPGMPDDFGAQGGHDDLNAQGGMPSMGPDPGAPPTMDSSAGLGSGGIGDMGGGMPGDQGAPPMPGAGPGMPGASPLGGPPGGHPDDLAHKPIGGLEMTDNSVPTHTDIESKGPMMKPHSGPPEPIPGQSSPKDYTTEKELEVISSKLDALRAALDSINQRMQNVEEMVRKGGGGAPPNNQW